MENSSSAPRASILAHTHNGMPANSSEITYDLSLLEKSRQRWESSPALRAVYADFFASIIGQAIPGDILDIGSGIGTIKTFSPRVTTSDVAPTPYADLTLSAYELAACGRSWPNICALDVLHHLREPLRFFASAAEVLQPHGRLILLEPAATLWGRLFYTLCHHEPIAPARIRPPFNFEPDSPDGDFANMGMAVALFRRHRADTARHLRQLGLRLLLLRYRDLLAYPATGGFSGPRILPAGLARRWVKAERALPQTLLRHLGLRVLVVIERLPA